MVHIDGENEHDVEVATDPLEQELSPQEENDVDSSERDAAESSSHQESEESSSPLSVAAEVNWEESTEDFLESEQQVEFPVVEADVSGTELSAFNSADVEEVEFKEYEEVVSIVESLLFAADKPMGLGSIKKAFQGTQVKTKDIKKAIEELSIEYAGAKRGVCVEEVGGGYQLRTKMDNRTYLKRMTKARPFKLSGPAMEVLSIVAYKQPCVKFHVDEIRGVESGHLIRGLMDRGLCSFAGKSDLPGKPMFYQTTKKFLEIFGLRNLKELPTLSEIDELIPEGIGDEEEKKEELSDITGGLSQEAGKTYSEGEEELHTIEEELSEITTSSEFFEEEKRREREKRDRTRAEDLREALLIGEEIDPKDQKWLERYELKQLQLSQEEEEKNQEEVEIMTEGFEGESLVGEGEETIENVEATQATTQNQEIQEDSLNSEGSETQVESDEIPVEV